MFCKGAKKNKGTFLSSTEILSFSEMVLFSGNSELYHMTSAETIEVFYNLRMDVDKLSYAASMLKIINDVCVEGETSIQKLQLLLNSLYVLSETDKNPDFVLAVFKLRLLGILGFIPRLAKCVNCHMEAKEMDEIFFSIKDDGVKCLACSKQDKGAIRISDGSYTSLLYIFSADAKKLFSFEIPEEAMKELELVSKIYTNEKLEKEYEL